MVERLRLPSDAAILDAGGGASRLAGELLVRGFSDVTVTDISAAALARARAELGERADAVTWVQGDLRTLDLGRRFDLWHDRAVLHFQVEATDRAAYLDTLGRSLAGGGYAVIATFGPEGPTSCSGLPVRRYDADALVAELGPEYELELAEIVTHPTPGGDVQQFLYAVLRRR